MVRTLPLDDKNFNDSALKIYVFKCLFEDMDNPEYNNAKNFIKRKFIDLKSKIISNFKEGFIKKDIILVNVPFLVMLSISCPTARSMSSWTRYQTTTTKRHSKSPTNCIRWRLIWWTPK